MRFVPGNSFLCYYYSVLSVITNTIKEQEAVVMADEPSVPKGTVVITRGLYRHRMACAFHLDRLGFRVFAGIKRTDPGRCPNKKSGTV